MCLKEMPKFLNLPDFGTLCREKAPDSFTESRRIIFLVITGQNAEDPKNIDKQIDKIKIQIQRHERHFLSAYSVLLHAVKVEQDIAAED